jgi:pyruvate,water dikinase
LSSPSPVIALRDITDAQTASTGPKALSLARLMRLGLPVPAGFCIVAEAYRHHLASAGLTERVRETIVQARAAPAEQRGAILDQLRQAIVAATLTVEFRSAIEQAYQALETRRVAVRSSSTAEDLPGLSFAGLYDTSLLKADIWGCFDAVKKCWASLWTERAFDYRERNRVDHINARMAVIVQRLIPAATSGVIFTADPVSGSNDRIVVESVFGLGEGLVSGKVVPDRLVLNRADLALLDRSISAKTARIVFSEQWGVREWPVEDDQQQTPSIDEPTARTLVRMALTAEKSAGKPLDIEWCASDNELFLLQARPITVLPGRKSWEERQVWSNVNIAETLPDVLAPMSWSVARIFVDAIFGWLMKFGGVRVTDVHVSGQVAGRAYINLNVFVGIVRSIPLLNRMKLKELFGGLSEDAIPDPADIPRFRGSLLRVLGSIPGFIIWFLLNPPRRGCQAIARLTEVTDQLQRSDYAGLPDDRLNPEVMHGLNHLLDNADEIGGALTGMMYYSTLFDVCRRWFGDTQGAVASHLLVNLGEVTSARAGVELWQLAQIARARPTLKSLVLSPLKWTELRERIAGVELGAEFLARWDNVMFQHGHHCRGETDIALPRWRDHPDFVLDSVRSLVRADTQVDPETEFRARAAERDTFTDECRRRLRNPLKRVLFNFLVTRARDSAGLRENLRNESNRRIGIARIVLQEVGRRLAAAGTLAEPDDVFYLYLEELEPVRLGIQAFDVRNTIADRKADLVRFQAIAPPPVIIGKFEPEKHPPPVLDENCETLTGLAVSPGIATGPARVITMASTSEQVLPGEILIAPHTDPGWTPYFLPAAGIVVDMGGLLSHGSIVAREYGKPAVVNVGPATRIIKTGQMVQVDGTTGKVRVLPRTEAR